MTSEKQLIANKENGKKGGVKSPEGKKVVKKNALKHGLTSSKVTLLEVFEGAGELYSKTLDEFKKAFKPEDEFELSALEQMALSTLKRVRYEQIESSNLIEEHGLCHPGTYIKYRSLDRAATHLKYIKHIENSYYRALDSLLKYRQAKKLEIL